MASKSGGTQKPAFGKKTGPAVPSAKGSKMGSGGAKKKKGRM